ncbi:MAG: McrB family protein [Thermoleophilaceae bacterium]
MPNPLATAITTYNPAIDADRIVQGEAQRTAVTTAFPMADWQEGFALERYAIGQEDSSGTFCRQMDYETPDLGSLGGRAAGKLIIYKHKAKEGWHFDPKYGSVENAWAIVSKAFADAMAFASDGDWTAIGDLEALSPGQALLTKTLHVYFQDEILPIYSRAHLRHYLGVLERPEANEQSLDAIRLNRALRDALHALPGGAAITTAQYQRLLYRHVPPPSASKMWKVSPGPKASQWDECRDGGYVCVGWGEVGDLRDYGARDDFGERFSELYADSLYGGKANVTSRKASEVWRMRELAVGDRIVAADGKSKVLAVGTVIEPIYSFVEDRGDFPHLIHAEWDLGYAKTITTQGGWLNTIDRVSSSARAEILQGPSTNQADPIDVVDNEDIELYTQISESLGRRKQAVLYGPPGTGKTYHARRFAAWWLQGGVGDHAAAGALADASALAAAEAALRAEGRWELVTFHPSYGYEDFIEGFRPVKSPAGGGVTLDLQDGIFKRLCERAAKRPKERFLLVIDEINRANVSKVFGELITLIESDKRGLTVTLPQSKTPFAVPSNLYVLGTMNTADRSITLLDAALRRRFSFIELMPDSDKLESDLGLIDLLDGLNRRLAQVVGRERQIGHAFFMPGGEVVSDVEDFARIIREEVVPLLQEYCYDEYGDLEQILGSQIVDANARVLHLGDAAKLLAALRGVGPEE